MRFHLVQLNPTVGDLAGNRNRILQFYSQAVNQDSDCVIFPELAVIGYPPQDLLLVNNFIRDQKATCDDIAAEIGEVPAILGFVDTVDGALFSAAAVMQYHRIQNVVHKRLLPTYDVFDEARYFDRADRQKPVKINSNGMTATLGIHICEDLWDNYSSIKPVDDLAADGASILVNLSASPYYRGKSAERVKLAREKVHDIGKAFLYCNQVGGQDDLIFDGSSFVLSSTGNFLAEGAPFREEVIAVEISGNSQNRIKGHKSKPLSREEELFSALELGLRDYCRKSGFESVVLGLSGGVDSALVATIAAEALGPDNVYGLSMPSVFSSDHSRQDAETLADNLGIHFQSIPIHSVHQAYLDSLADIFRSTEPDTTEENIQARIRGNILMALSNKFGHLVLSTGNKTELALGYCTLYGDMTGGLSVISDVSKLDVYGLCEWYNHNHEKEIIPDNILTKPPSAELKSDQVDPFDYNVVSPLVDKIVEHHRSVRSLADEGYDADLARETIRRIRRAEYKRRQAAPGLKVTRKSFGSGRRFPIVNHYREEDTP